MLDLSGKFALVTGGARGVGRSVVTELAEHGAHVIINCFHSYPEAKALRAELSAQGFPVDVIRASVAKEEQVDRMFDEIEQRYGRLDILVNNAASGGLRPAAETTAAHFRKALDTNLLGSFWCAQRSARLMPAGGAIVNVSSIGAGMVLENYLSVGTSKAAVEALTRHLAVAYAPQNIRVNTASCSLIDGDVATLFPRHEEMQQVTVAATPMGRLATAEDLARVVLFLVCDLSRWVTGQTILADGGLSLGSAMLSPPRAPAVRAERDRSQLAVAAVPPASGVPAPDTGDSDAIAVVGMGLVLPGANSPEELWRLRLSGSHVFTEVPADRWRLESFYDPDPAVKDKTYSRWSGFITDFRPHPALDDATADGPEREYTTRWLRHALLQALDGVARTEQDRVSCFVGYTADGSQHLEEAIVLAGLRQRLDATHGAVRDRLEAHLRRGTGNTADFLPHRVGHRAITGVLPADTELFMVDTACSSSLYTVDLGIKTLRLGECDVAVCGGAFALGPRGAVLFSKLGGLARSGEVRSLDRSGDGVLFSDGAGVVVLKKLSRALADGDEVLGLLAGAGTSSDGKGKAIYAPSSAGQEIAVRRALTAPGVAADRIDWVVAHATGTPAGDLAELRALQNSFPADQPIQVTSSKSVIGHAGWAAGVASLIEVLLGMRHTTIPQQTGFEAPPGDFDADRSALRIPRRPVPWPVREGRPRCASVSSFGFGGTNAHLVVEEYQGQRPAPAEPVAPGERLAVVGWSAHVPGLDSADEVAGWLRGTGVAPAASFGDAYPVPPFHRVRIPPKTLRMLDRCQLMVLECVAKLEQHLGGFWSRHRNTTGVIAGHMGPTRQGTLYALRCQLDDIRELLGDDAAATDFMARLVADVERLVSASNEDSFPGIMPNVIPARVANYFDFHGFNMTVDNGFASTSSALDVAARYLRSGDLDLALVFGINGNSTPELAEVVASLLPDGTRVAEGAFLFAVTRAATAAEHDLPVLGYLDELGAAEAGGTPGTSYLGADSAVSLLRSILGVGDPKRDGGAPPVSLKVARHRMTLSPLPLVRIRPLTELFAPGTVLLTDRPELLADQPLAGVTVLSTAPLPADRPGWTHLPRVDPETVASALSDLGEPRHLRVVTDLEAAVDPARVWEVSPALLALHDLIFLTLQRCHDAVSREGSLVVLMLSGRPGGTWHPFAGMFTGLVKSVALELPDCQVCAVVSSTADLATGVRQATAETAAHQFLPVVVYDGDERRCLFMDEAAEEPAGADSGIGESSVVLACGGARGIGAEALKALARAYRPVIYVLGTNPLDGYPTELTGGSDEEFAAGRVSYLREEKARRPQVSVAHLNAEYDLIGNARIARHNLAEMAAHSGADRVHYLRCDMRNRAEVVETVAEILRRECRIDLLLNVAGLSRSAAIPNKKWDDFRNVRDIKIEAYQNLRYALRDNPPRMWCNFGSFVGFTGQVGEVDYTSGNDFLGTASCYVAEVGGQDEFTIGWALWYSTGLGSSPVTRAFLEKSGLYTSMSTEEGVHHFLDEVRRSRHMPVVLYLGDLEKRAVEDDIPGFFTAREKLDGGPFYLDVTRRGRRGELWAERVFDLSRDGYLAHHVVHGHPTLPGTFVPEIAAQAAMELVPGRVPAVFEDATFQSFLRIYAADRPAVKRIQARVIAQDDRESCVHVRILADVTAPNGVLLVADKVHFEVTVRLRDELPPAPAWESWTPGEDEVEVLDPYHVPNPAAHLTGPFVSTTGTRTHRLGRRARFALRVPPDDPVFSRFVLPSILLDGLARTSVLEPVDGGYLPLVAPARMRRIDLYELRNDCALAAAYPSVELYSSPRHLDLEAPRPDNRCVAVAPDGRVLLQIKDITGVVLGYVHQHTGEFRSPDQWARGAQVPAAAVGG